MEAELGEVGGEAGLRRGDAEVGGQGHAEATADRRALHGGDDRQRLLEQALGLVVQVAAVVGRVGRAGRRRGSWHRRRSACPRRTARWPGVVARRQLLAGVGDLGDQRLVEEVVRRPMDLDLGDVVADASSR